MKIKLFMLTIALVILVGCEEVNTLTKIELPFTHQVTIPKGTPANVDLPPTTTPYIVVNLDSVFKKHDIDASYVQSISLTNMEMELKMPENSDLGFIKNLEVYIMSENLNEVMIAGASNVSLTPGKKLVLQTQNVALKDFLLKDKFKLKFKLATQKALTDDHKVDLKFKFLVDLKVFGL